MFTVLHLVQPDTLAEAYRVLMEKRTNAVLGGCAFLRMGTRNIGTAIDLSKLSLNYIKDQMDYIEIGATTTLRDIETSPLLQHAFSGILPKAVRNIIGVQFRNVVMVGATVYSHYGFSDLLTALLALDTEIELFKGGRMSLENFLAKSYEKDILTRLFIKQKGCKAAYQNLRNSASDYPILTVAASHGKQWTLVVGARPLRATIAHAASAKLSQMEWTDKNIDEIAVMVSQEVTFGTNMRGTAQYREAMCKVLVKRAIQEVVQCESK